MRRTGFVAAVTISTAVVLASPAAAAPSPGWHVVPADPRQSQLSAVSCVSATWCLAVGNNTAETWNGRYWRSVATVTDPLADVSCTSAQSCLAVGNGWVTGADPRDGYPIGILDHWTGSGWQSVPLPPAVAQEVGTLNGISCPAPTECMAVGLTDKALRWQDSAWTVDALPLPAGATWLRLNAVDCPSADNCQAVGYAGTGPDQHAVAGSWDGTTWTTEWLPDLSGDVLPYFSRISCASAASCVAVGARYDNEGAVAESWDGTTWRPTPTPYDDTHGAGIWGVDCMSPTSCVAVGWVSFTTLSPHLQWDGATWSSVPGPGIGTELSNADVVGIPLGVDCPDPSTCLAVGALDDETAAVSTAYAERWTSG